MNLKKEIRRVFEKAEDFRDIQFLAVRLVDEEYNPEEIAKYAVEKGYSSRLGYLAETALEAAKRRGLTKKNSQLETLVEKLHPHVNSDYQFLFSYPKDEWHGKLRKFIQEQSTSPRNVKWHIHSSLSPEEIEEYLQLYLIDLKQGIYVKEGKDTILTK